MSQKLSNTTQKLKVVRDSSHEAVLSFLNVEQTRGRGKDKLLGGSHNFGRIRTLGNRLKTNENASLFETAQQFNKSFKFDTSIDHNDMSRQLGSSR